MRLRAPLAAAVLAALALAAPAAAPAAPFHSDNVSLVTKLPESAGAISARFSPDGKTMYVSSLSGLGIYDVSEPANPQRLSRLVLPHLENEDVDAGRIGDRDIVIIVNDPAFNSGAYGAMYVVDVTNRRLPTILSATPTRLPRQIRDQLGFADAKSNNGHIASCIQGCRYVWTTGNEEGVTVYDLADPAHPKLLGAFTMPVPKNRETPGFTHDVFVDRAGIAWVTGEDGTFGYDTNGMTDPLAPRLVYRSDENVTNTGGGLPGDDGQGPLDFLHHNLIRTSIGEPKAPGPPPGVPAPDGTPPAGHGDRPARPAPSQSNAVTGASSKSTAKRKAKSKRKPRASRCAKVRKPAARKRCLRAERRRAAARKRAADRRRAAARKRKSAEPQRRVPARVRTTTGGLGDVLAVTEEDYLKPGCPGQGSLQTWRIDPAQTNSDGTVKLTMLDQWTTELNELQELKGRSNPAGAPTTANCSAHWFDESRGLLAQGWYDQGIRFMDVSNPADIRQVGYWVTAGEYWAAYYAPTDPQREIVYALDTVGGIEVLRIDRDASTKPVSIPVLDQQRIAASRSSAGTPHPVYGFACKLPAL